MFFSFAHVASFQHGIFPVTDFFSIQGFHVQNLCVIGQLCSFYALNAFDSLFSDLLNIQFSFAAYTDNIRFLPVYPVFFDELVKTVCITWFEANHGFSFHLGSFDHIFAQVCSAKTVIHKILQRFFCLKIRRFRIVRQVSGFPAKHPGNGFVRQQFFCTVDYFLHLKSPNLTFFPRE